MIIKILLKWPSWSNNFNIILQHFWCIIKWKHLIYFRCQFQIISQIVEVCIELQRINDFVRFHWGPWMKTSWVLRQSVSLSPSPIKKYLILGSGCQCWKHVGPPKTNLNIFAANLLNIPDGKLSFKLTHLVSSVCFCTSNNFNIILQQFHRIGYRSYLSPLKKLVFGKLKKCHDQMTLGSVGSS